MMAILGNRTRTVAATLVLMLGSTGANAQSAIGASPANRRHIAFNGCAI